MSAPDLQLLQSGKEEYVVTENGEVRYEKTLVGKLLENWRNLDINILVRPGIIWTARMDDHGKFGLKVLRYLVLVSGLSILFMLALVMALNSGNGSATAPSLLEFVLSSPVTLLTLGASLAVGGVIQFALRKKGWSAMKLAVISGGAVGVGLLASAAMIYFENSKQAAGAPQIDFGQIQWQSRVALNGQDAQSDWVTKGSDLDNIIKAQLTSLNKDGKLASRFATAPMTDIRKTWAYQAASKRTDTETGKEVDVPAMEGGKPDSFRVAVGDGTVFIFSIVFADSNWTPWAGVFRKESSGWTYKNLSVPGVPVYQVKGYSTVPASEIPFAVAKQFPVMVRPAQQK